MQIHVPQFVIVPIFPRKWIQEVLDRTGEWFCRLREEWGTLKCVMMSSRSVFIIKVAQINKFDNSSLTGNSIHSFHSFISSLILVLLLTANLNLVDLAGSEKQKLANSSGQTLEEVFSLHSISNLPHLSSSLFRQRRSIFHCCAWASVLKPCRLRRTCCLLLGLTINRLPLS